MKKLPIILGAILLVVFGLAGIATADNGPHGGYSAMTDKCAACHRAHTALGDNLLVGNGASSSFCYSCHSGGTGAYTDVSTGKFNDGATLIQDQRTTTATQTYGTSNKPLRGGGFDSTWMNADLATTTQGALRPVTSKHDIDGVADNTVWGYGALGTAGAGPQNVSLTCTNCHNPHGSAGAGNSATYRILKGNNASNTALFVSGATSVNPSIDVPDEYTKTYMLGSSNYDSYVGITLDGVIGGSSSKTLYRDNYFSIHATGNVTITGSAANRYVYATEWCSQCHQRYNAPTTEYSLGITYTNSLEGPGSTDSGDATYTHRHAVNPPFGSSLTNGAGTTFTAGGNVASISNCEWCHFYNKKGAFNTADGYSTGGGSGYSTFPYTQKANSPVVPSCLNCHMAHGTGATMGGWADDVEWPDGSTTPNGNSRSALLRLDNRGVCEACHLKK